AADRKSLKKARGKIGSAQTDHFLIRIDRRAGLGGVRPRQDAGVRERHHGDSTATDNDVAEVSKTDLRQGKQWQSLRRRTENLHPGGSPEVQYIDHDSCGGDREQKTRNALVGLEQKDRGGRGGADCE